MQFTQNQISSYPSFSLFEDSFSEFIHQGKNIIIHNVHGFKNARDNWASDSLICTVNECSTPDAFRKKLHNLILKALKDV